MKHFGDESEDQPDVVVPVTQKLAQNIDCHYPQAGVRFDVQDCQNCLIKNRVPDILGRISVGGHLSKNVIHGFTSAFIPFA